MSSYMKKAIFICCIILCCNLISCDEEKGISGRFFLQNTDFQFLFQDETLQLKYGENEVLNAAQTQASAPLFYYQIENLESSMSDFQFRPNSELIFEYQWNAPQNLMLAYDPQGFYYIYPLTSYQEKINGREYNPYELNDYEVQYFNEYQKDYQFIPFRKKHAARILYSPELEQNIDFMADRFAIMDNNPHTVFFFPDNYKNQYLEIQFYEKIERSTQVQAQPRLEGNQPTAQDYNFTPTETENIIVDIKDMRPIDEPLLLSAIMITTFEKLEIYTPNPYGGPDIVEDNLEDLINHSRVKKIKLSFADNYYAGLHQTRAYYNRDVILELSDNIGEEIFIFEPPIPMKSIKLEILDIYPGLYPEPTIADLNVYLKKPDL